MYFYKPANLIKSAIIHFSQCMIKESYTNMHVHVFIMFLVSSFVYYQMFLTLWIFFRLPLLSVYSLSGSSHSLGLWWHLCHFLLECHRRDLLIH